MEGAVFDGGEEKEGRASGVMVKERKKKKLKRRRSREEYEWSRR